MVKVEYNEKKFPVWFSDKKEIETDDLQFYQSITGEEVTIIFGKNKEIIGIKVQNG